MFKNFKFWRYLINFWSFLFFIFIICDFLTNNSCLEILSALSTVYISVLAIYVSNKEFERWYDRHQGQHPGEVFVIAWSILIFVLLVLDFVFAKSYTMPSSVLSAYIAVLTILVITAKSKEMYQSRKQIVKVKVDGRMPAKNKNKNKK